MFGLIFSIAFWQEQGRPHVLLDVRLISEIYRYLILLAIMISKEMPAQLATDTSGVMLTAEVGTGEYFPLEIRTI